MHFRLLLLSVLVMLCVAALACNAPTEKPTVQPAQPAKATETVALSEKEKDEGWRLLFDGKTLNGWRGFRQETVPSAWQVENGLLKKNFVGLKPNGDPINGPDLITTEQFENFELQLEWKLEKGGNGGIKYLVSESLFDQKHPNSGISFEMQVLDDIGHPDAKKGINGNRTAGSLYDLIPAKQDKPIKPVGEWNQVRLLKRGAHIEHWLNGQKALEFEQGSAELKTLIAGSKFKNRVGFGEAKKGHILLQDHGNVVWYRNIKIRELK